MRSRVLIDPIVEKVVRDRTFEVIQMRTDRQDMLVQLVSLLNTLLDEKFNGHINIGVHGGRVIDIHAHDVTKIWPRTK